MNELFGLSMNVIMVVLLVAFALCMAVFAGIFFANRTMFHMGLRNIGRRRAQTALVVSGLMLATVIITAAFTTGDVIDYSATKMTYDNLQRTDLSLHHFRPLDAGEAEVNYAPESVRAGFEEAFAGDPDIEGFVPFLYEPVPVLNPASRLSEPVAILSGYDPERLSRFGGLQLTDGSPADIAGLADDEVLLGERIADAIEARTGDTVAIFARDREVPLRVAGIVRDERAAGTLDFGPGADVGGMAVTLATAQRITGREGLITTINVVLKGGVRGTLDRVGAAEDRLLAFEADEAAKARIGLANVRFQVEPIKADAIADGQETAETFTTAFLALGLFSIAAGAMLIFTLFVMLAAERRPEMGIARAVGAQRTHLVQAFVAEGFVYELLAGLVGVALGVAAAFVLVVGGVKLMMGDQLESITAHAEPRSLIVSFCLGAVLMFLTVTFSSLRISQLNVVAAIRGQAGEAHGHEPKRRTRWPWIVLGVLVLLPVPPLGLYWILRKGIGMSWAWIIGPVGFLLGALLIAAGGATLTAFPFFLGVSLVILAIASTAAYYGVPSRVAWTAGGLVLAVYWMFPTLDAGDHIFGEFEETGTEMFVLSGIMIVTGLTTATVLNVRLLTRMFTAQRGGASRYVPTAVTAVLAGVAAAIGFALGDRADGLGQLGYLAAVFLGLFALTSAVAVRYPQLAPAFKMAVAYPMANRFRTGMTVAMFSIVVFSITVMAILNTSFLDMFQSEEGRGGWDIIASTNDNNPVDDLPAALRDAGFDTSLITAAGRTTQFDDNAQEVREPGGTWQTHPVVTGDAAFFANAEMKLQGVAKGYESAEDVYAAVAPDPDLALLDAAPLDEMANFPFHIDLDIEDGHFEPFELEFRDRVTGATRTVTVIGILSSRIPPGFLMGLYANEAAYRDVFGPPKFNTVYLRTEPGANDSRLAKDIKAALLEKGVQAVSVEEEIGEAVAISVAILRIFQAFMGLGLFVGIAALGVIALRSVVERRQQIGMLRAIGYPRGTVALSFVLESGFVVMTGIVSGVIGASILSWSLVHENDFTAAPDAAFIIPWLDIAVVVILAFAFALAMTWWPSRRAASVPVAEALRYE